MSAEAQSPVLTLKNREIIVGVCGGIAAYKVADVVSKLVQLGAGVRVVMTSEAKEFVTPLTFQALSARTVLTSTFDLTDSSDPQHIALTERADLMLIAPATSNMTWPIWVGRRLGGRDWEEGDGWTVVAMFGETS